MHLTLRTRVLAWFCAVLLAAPALAQEEGGDKKPEEKPEFPPIKEVVKDGQKIDGYLTLYQTDEALYAAIPGGMLEKPFMLSASIARGISQGRLVAGMTFGQSMYYWQRADKRMFLVEKNVRHTARSGDPINQAVQEGFGDSIVAVLPIRAKDGNTVLVDLADFLFTDYLMVGEMLSFTVGRSYRLDRQRTVYGPVKSYPMNTDIEVEATYASSLYADLRTVPDSRALPIALYYSFSKIPETGYKPRIADERMGYFLTARKNYSQDGPEEPFERYINRWHLEKANPDAKLSPPKKPIVFYIEKSVPYEYRPIVRDGVLAWNEAFEQAGFRNAIEVRYQEEDATWDAEDVRYNTIRWMTSESTYAIGPSRTNPITGEIYDADILIDAGWLRFYEVQYDTLIASLETVDAAARERGDAASLEEYTDALAARISATVPEAEPYGLDACTYASGFRGQLALASMAAQIYRDAKKEDGEAAEEEPASGIDLFVEQALKELVMHEVGHTLGLRHNFKASSITPVDKLHDKEWAEENGLYGSVMDYNLVNVAPPGTEQGYFFTPRIGPWDRLVIEYGYTPVTGDEQEALAAIAARSAEAPYVYATDEDVARDVDPYTERWDMSADPLAFAEQRVALIRSIWDDPPGRIGEEGQSYRRLRSAFTYTLFDKQRSLYHASQFVGGFKVNRVHKSENDDAGLPLEVVPAEQQRKALHFVCDQALADGVYTFDPDLLSRLAPNHWRHWGSDLDMRVDPPVHDMVLSGQLRILQRLFSVGVLERVHDGALHMGEDAFTLDEIYTTVTNAVFSELDEAPSGDGPYISSFRRNLQRAMLNYVLLRQAVNPSSALPQDARAMAWSSLQQLRSRINERLLDEPLGTEGTLDPLSEAHLREMRTRINNALDVTFTTSTTL